VLLLYGQGEDFGLDLPIFVNDDLAAGDGELEAAWAAGAGVEVENAFVMADLWFVGMAIEDCRKSCGCGVEIELMHVVEQVEGNFRIGAGQRDYFGFGELGAGAVGVDVAADGGDWGDGCELAEDFRVAYVAEMQDVVGACQERKDFGAEEAVGVGEDADAHSDCSENTEYAREIFGPEDLVLFLASFCDDDPA